MEWLGRISLITTWAVARYLMDLYQIKEVIPRAHFLLKTPRTLPRPWRRFMLWTFQSIRTFQGMCCPIVWCEAVRRSHPRLLTHRHLQVRRWGQALLKALARNKCKCNHRLSVLLAHSLPQGFLWRDGHQAVRLIVPSWFEHVEECFSHQEVQIKKVCSPVKTSSRLIRDTECRFCIAELKTIPFSGHVLYREGIKINFFRYTSQTPKQLVYCTWVSAGPIRAKRLLQLLGCQ